MQRHADPGNVLAWPRKACHEPGLDYINRKRQDWNRPSDLLGGLGGAAVCSDDKIDLAACEVVSLFNVLFEGPAGAVFKCDGATLDVTKALDEPLPKGAGASMRLRVRALRCGECEMSGAPRHGAARTAPSPLTKARRFIR